MEKSSTSRNLMEIKNVQKNKSAQVIIPYNCIETPQKIQLVILSLEIKLVVEVTLTDLVGQKQQNIHKLNI